MTTKGHSEAKVALVTGGASGIGLSVVERLISDGWNVTVLDLNREAGQKHADRLGTQFTFIGVDATDYEQLSSAFVRTWEKHHRLDFVFANAGITDRQYFYEPAADRADGSPAKPDTLVIGLGLMHVVYSAWLALHYFRKNATKSGKLVNTSSMAGLYPVDALPLYTAANHGVVGITRALGQRLEELKEPITVNCICPGLVDTDLTHTTILPNVPQKLITPHATVVKAVIGFLEDDSKTGLVAECSINNIYYRKQLEWGDEMSEALMARPFENIRLQKPKASA